MPDAESSGESAPMNGVLRAKLREYAAELRRRKAGGEAAGVLRAAKTRCCATVYRMLAIHLGRPPSEFDWQWRDKDDEFHRDGTITPAQFYERYVALDLDDYVSLINCPTADKPFNALYTVEHLGNVVGGTPVRYVNVDMAAFKKAAAAQIAAGQPVWFGCDVGKMAERDSGALDREMYDLELLYATELRRRQGGARRVRPQRHDPRHGAHRRRHGRRPAGRAAGRSRTAGARRSATRATS